MPRKTPRISVMKLAEYLGAGAVRRRTIIRNQQVPPEPIVPQYRRTLAPVVSFLRKGGKDLRVLADAADRLEQQIPTGDWDARDLRNSADALRHLINVAPLLDLGDRVLGGRRGTGQIWMAGVELSVRPHVRIWRAGTGRSEVGAIKLSFAKTRVLPEDEARRAATLLRHFLDEKLDGSEAVAAPALCQVVDVFREEIFAAPAAYKRTIADAEAACEEIRRVWMGAGTQATPVQPHLQPTMT